MTRLKKVLAALIAVVFAALSCLPGVLVLAENAQANTLSILLLYDDSYEQTLRRQGYSIDEIEHRIEQIGELSELSFTRKYNLRINFTVEDYSSVIGEEYALQCPVGNG